MNSLSIKLVSATACLFALAMAAIPALAQSAALPSAPAVHLLVAPAAQSAGAAQAQQAPTAAPGSSSQSTGPTLTVGDAEQMALHNNPNISVAHLLALAQGQVTREVRAGELPTINGDLTAVGAHQNSRITAGYLSNSAVYDRAAGGLTADQLITDFGRTHNLVLSAQSNAKAQLEDERATELDIRLAVDEAFYKALIAQSVLQVAQQTVAQRKATSDQVGALTNAKVKSDLDLSFANVQLSQSNLLLIDAENNAQTAMAELNNVLGNETDQQFTLVDETTGAPQPPPQDADAMLQTAFASRPDLAALNAKYTSALEYSKAERDLWMPTVSALAAAGGAPVRADQIQSSWYGVAGANISIPIFNGFLYNADEKEAKLKAQAAQQDVRGLRDVIARDVRSAVLNAQMAFQRIGVTQEELNQANFALDLAQARYKIGLSSIVELTQAQLAQTQAEIDNATARYGYQSALAEVRYEMGQ